ncbi:MAG: hypothetical protein KAR37_02675, partial [Alphaproteobacteria bacterium]|nr:hypothetical protein [Alphaproteobacteria bacterium]
MFIASSPSSSPTGKSRAGIGRKPFHVNWNTCLFAARSAGCAAVSKLEKRAERMLTIDEEGVRRLTAFGPLVEAIREMF